MRAFFKGVLIGTACMCVLALVWLCLVRPEITAHEAGSLKAEYSQPSPGADSSGALPAEERGKTALDLVALQQQYPDVRAWLTIPGTVVDYPVLQSSFADPEYYLRRNHKGEWRMAGSLFLQADCTPDGRSLVIYGHNMSDGTMFGCLPQYMTEGFLSGHDVILLQTLNETREYRIAAVLETDISHLPFTQTAFANDADFLAFAQMLKDNAATMTDVPITAESQLLTLVTCSYSWEDARYLVVAVWNPSQRRDVNCLL